MKQCATDGKKFAAVGGHADNVSPASMRVLNIDLMALSSPFSVSVPMESKTVPPL